MKSITRWMHRMLPIPLLNIESWSCVDVDGYRLRGDDAHLRESAGNGGVAAEQSATFSEIVVEAGTSPVAKAGGAPGVGGTTSRTTKRATGKAGYGGTGGQLYVGGATSATGRCEQIQESTCEQMTDLVHCEGLRGCEHNVRERCVAVLKRALTCADLSRTYSDCNALPGCASSGAGRCITQYRECVSWDPISVVCLDDRVECDRIYKATVCDAAGECRWVGEDGSCTGDAIACETFTTAKSCATSFNCTWGAFECSGVPMACELLTTSTACHTSTNCSWSVEL
ncbi:MAG TPA: hypothetical protein VKP30_13780 [Polyangiaceae bacterium]|nr:hypothetical protein [Polyangiaceae bacterium]